MTVRAPVSTALFIATRDVHAEGTVIDRRRCLRVLVAVGLAPIAGAACSHPEFACTDTASLTPAERALRTSFGYTDRGANSGHKCDVCTHFFSGGDSSCGTCTLVRGPIHPSGTCNIWVAKS